MAGLDFDHLVYAVHYTAQKRGLTIHLQLPDNDSRVNRIRNRRQPEIHRDIRHER